MATSRPTLRPLRSLKASIRQYRCQKSQQRWSSTANPATAHLREAAKAFEVPLPDPIFYRALKKKPSKRIPVVPSLPSYRNICREPLEHFASQQIAALDPTGARTRLFARDNPEAAKVGDILLVRQASGEPFSGVCMNIRRRGQDTGILLRNQLTRVGVEMWFKIYSPAVTGIEVVQRREKRARRARLYYMRKPKHDIGSVENIVRQYLRQRALMGSRQAKGRDANANKKTGSKKR